MISRSDFGWTRDLMLNFAYFESNGQFLAFQQEHPNCVLVGTWAVPVGGDVQADIESCTNTEYYKGQTRMGMFITYYHLTQESADSLIENQRMGEANG